MGCEDLGDSVGSISIIGISEITPGVDETSVGSGCSSSESVEVKLTGRKLMNRTLKYWKVLGRFGAGNKALASESDDILQDLDEIGEPEVVEIPDLSFLDGEDDSDGVDLWEGIDEVFGKVTACTNKCDEGSEAAEDLEEAS